MELIEHFINNNNLHDTEDMDSLIDLASLVRTLINNNQQAEINRVLQYTMDMVFVAEYPSMSVAGKQTGVRTGCISLCCKSKRKSAGGFIWKLKAVDSSG